MQTVFPDLENAANGILAVASPEKCKTCAVEIIKPGTPTTESDAAKRLPRYHVPDCPMW